MLRHLTILFFLMCCTAAQQRKLLFLLYSYALDFSFFWLRFNLDLNLTLSLSAAAVNSARRDVYFLQGDAAAWRYTACVADSSDKSRIRELTIQSQTGALGPFKSSYDGQSNIYDTTVVRNRLDQCIYVAIVWVLDL